MLAAAIVVLMLRTSMATLILIVVAVVVTAVAGYALKALFCKNDAGDIAAAAIGEPVSARAPAPAPKAAAAPVASAPSKAEPAAAPTVASTPDYDGDGKLEGADEGSKPAVLSAARAGGADDLKQIKGVGPKMENMLNDMGFYHFDQIAAWSGDEVAWVDANLKGFKGRVSRDNWVAQAKILATGGETEFSKRVEDGDVY